MEARRETSWDEWCTAQKIAVKPMTYFWEKTVRKGRVLMGSCKDESYRLDSTTHNTHLNTTHFRVSNQFMDNGSDDRFHLVINACVMLFPIP